MKHGIVRLLAGTAAAGAETVTPIHPSQDSGISQVTPVPCQLP